MVSTELSPKGDAGKQAQREPMMVGTPVVVAPGRADCLVRCVLQMKTAWSVSKRSHLIAAFVVTVLAVYNLCLFMLFGADAQCFPTSGRNLSSNDDCQPPKPFGKLGEGNFGEVFEARYQGDTVALKRAFGDRHISFEMLGQEVKVLNRLEDIDHVPRVIYDASNFSIFKTEPVEYAMTLYRGRSLAYLIENMETIPNNLLPELVDELQNIHRLGVLHRDLNAEHIIFADTSQNNFGIIDWGCASIDGRYVHSGPRTFPNTRWFEKPRAEHDLSAVVSMLCEIAKKVNLTYADQHLVPAKARYDNFECEPCRCCNNNGCCLCTGLLGNFLAGRPANPVAKTDFYQDLKKLADKTVKNYNSKLTKKIN